MTTKRRTTLILTVFFGLILLLQFIFEQNSPRIHFVKGSYTITYRIVGFLAFSTFLMGLVLLLTSNRTVKIVSGCFLFLILFINSCGEIYPIDTTTKPEDKAVLWTGTNGEKLIAREYKNAKTNRLIRDTVRVRDKWIF